MTCGTSSRRLEEKGSRATAVQRCTGLTPGSHAAELDAEEHRWLAITVEIGIA